MSILVWNLMKSKLRVRWPIIEAYHVDHVIVIMFVPLRFFMLWF